MKYILIPLCLLIFAMSAFAQEARLIDVLSDNHPCGDFIARMDGVYNGYKETADAKIYVIYYEGKHKLYNETKKINPRKGDALNRAKEVFLYFTKAEYRGFKLPENKIAIINGGHREDFALEIWIIPKNSNLPQPTPTLEEKDMKFRKGKPYKVRDFGQCV